MQKSGKENFLAEGLDKWLQEFWWEGKWKMNHFEHFLTNIK
jgi:hypothetical protein